MGTKDEEIVKKTGRVYCVCGSARVLGSTRFANRRIVGKGDRERISSRASDFPQTRRPIAILASRGERPCAQDSQCREYRLEGQDSRGRRWQNGSGGKDGQFAGSLDLERKGSKQLTRPLNSRQSPCQRWKRDSSWESQRVPRDITSWSC